MNQAWFEKRTTNNNLYKSAKNNNNTSLSTLRQLDRRKNVAYKATIITQNTTKFCYIRSTQKWINLRIVNRELTLRNKTEGIVQDFQTKYGMGSKECSQSNGTF